MQFTSDVAAQAISYLSCMPNLPTINVIVCVSVCVCECVCVRVCAKSECFVFKDPANLIRMRYNNNKL